MCSRKLTVSRLEYVRVVLRFRPKPRLKVCRSNGKKRRDTDKDRYASASANGVHYGGRARDKRAAAIPARIDGPVCCSA